MKDNFNIHEWRLKQAINEEKTLNVTFSDEDWSQSIAYKLSDALLKSGYSRDMVKQVAKSILNRPSLQENKGQCPDCGCKMEGTMCNECGYMEEGATFTDKHDDNPKLKGGQKDLPDELQAKIVAKEGESNLTPLQQYIYDYEVEISGEDFANEELENIKKLNNIDDVKKYYGSYRGWAVDKDLKYEFYNLIKTLKSKKLAEGEDHEVSMAQNSLKSIISSASQLMSKLGNDERDIPGWIQDHITNAENYIDQAAQGFHELDNNNEED